MLLVRAWVGASKIHGLGLIAHEFIPKGTLVWKLDPEFDLVLPAGKVHALPEFPKEQFLYYAFIDPLSKRYVLCSDDARFTNHSDDPNCTLTGDFDYAIRDIYEGEELTDDYNQYGYVIRPESRPVWESK